MFCIAKKVGMTRLFIDGEQVPVTALEIQKSHVLQTKTLEKDGYKAVQLGAVPRSKANKPKAGHVKKYTGESQDFQHIVEFPISDLAEDKKYFDVEDFQEGSVVSVTGKTIGRGFTGVMKRHNFHGQPASHGHDHERAPGSIGSRWPQRVVPGKKMAGHYGNENKTLNPVKIVAVDKENQLVFVQGSLPGANSSYLQVKKA